jgi:hypothetical protein
MSKAFDDMAAVISGVKQKVLDLQAKLAAGGMTADEEAQITQQLADLSQTADPAQPNP